jgi:hypothetical protein
MKNSFEIRYRGNSLTAAEYLTSLLRQVPSFAKVVQDCENCTWRKSVNPMLPRVETAFSFYFALVQPPLFFRIILITSPALTNSISALQPSESPAGVILSDYPAFLSL